MLQKYPALPPAVKLMGINIHPVNYGQVIDYLLARLLADQSTWVVTPNPEILLHAQQDPAFAKLLNQADLSLPDGIGLLPAAKFANWQLPAGWPQILFWPGRLAQLFVCLSAIWLNRSWLDVLPQVVSGDLLTIKLAAMAEKYSFPVLLLGGQSDTATRAAKQLKIQFPSLQVQGLAGPADIAQASDKQLQHLLAQIKKIKPKIILVAFGAPKQEQWIAQYRRHFPGSLLMGVGGTLDELAGRYPTTPMWLRRLGLRWLWRLLTQPWRARRIFRAVVVFNYRLLQLSATTRSATHSSGN